MKAISSIDYWWLLQSKQVNVLKKMWPWCWKHIQQFKNVIKKKTVTYNLDLGFLAVLTSCVQESSENISNFIKVSFILCFYFCSKDCLLWQEWDWKFIFFPGIAGQSLHYLATFIFSVVQGCFSAFINWHTAEAVHVSHALNSRNLKKQRGSRDVIVGRMGNKKTQHIIFKVLIYIYLF